MCLLFRLFPRRFVRIGHGIVEVTHELSDQKYEGVIEYVLSLEELCEENGIDLPHHKKSIDKLKKSTSHALSHSPSHPDSHLHSRGSSISSSGGKSGSGSN